MNARESGEVYAKVQHRVHEVAHTTAVAGELEKGSVTVGDLRRSVETRLAAVSMPRTRAMGSGLFEVRAKGRDGIARAFFCTLAGKQLVILQAIIKKTEKTPARHSRAQD